MATKKTETVEEPAPVVVQPVKGRSGLAIAGIVVGAVIVAGALFGGGVLVGANLAQGPSQAQFGPGGMRPEGGFPGGPNGNGGPGPVMPGDGDADTDQN
jgi:hypothetical protein